MYGINENPNTKRKEKNMLLSVSAEIYRVKHLPTTVTKAKQRKLQTFKEATVAVSGTSMKSSGTLNDLMLNLTGKET